MTMDQALAILRGDQPPDPPPAAMIPAAIVRRLTLDWRLGELLSFEMQRLPTSPAVRQWSYMEGARHSVADVLASPRDAPVELLHSWGSYNTRGRRAGFVPANVAEEVRTYVEQVLRQWYVDESALADAIVLDAAASAAIEPPAQRQRCMIGLRRLAVELRDQGARIAPRSDSRLYTIPTGSPTRWRVEIEPSFCGSRVGELTFSEDFGAAAFRCHCQFTTGADDRPCSTAWRVPLALWHILDRADDIAHRAFLDQVAFLPHERLLRALVSLDSVSDDDAVALGWRFKTESEGQRDGIVPVRIAETKTGKLRVRQLAWRDLDTVADVQSPVDGEIALLLRLALGHSGSGGALGGHVDTFAAALQRLVGHPWAFVGQAREPSAVVAAPVTLSVSAQDGGATLQALVAGEVVDGPSLSLRLRAVNGALWQLVKRQQQTVIQVVTAPPRLLDTLAQLGPEGAHVPTSVLPELRAQLAKVARLAPLRADEAVLGLGVVADAKPWLRLSLGDSTTQLGDLSLHAELCVRPFETGAFMTAGEGEALLFAAGQPPRHTRRDLAAERAAVGVAATLLAMPTPAATFTGEAALELLAIAAAQPDLRVLWERGSLRARHSRVARARLQVQSRTDWLALGGKLEIDGVDAALSDVLVALREGRRWIRLGDASWAKIEGELADALQSVALRLDGTGDNAKLPALAVDLLEAAEAQGAELHGDRAWGDRRAKLQQARTMAAPPPEGLEAELRDYQREGIAWLQRLAFWAPGAVLADDMGLGKTLQALALLLARAEHGPSLVVAPTSLGFGWAREAAAFTPDLRILPYRGPVRAERLGIAGPGDVLVTSYDVMLRDVEVLAAREFSTIVFDEAQAMKNPQSLRARAALRLQGGFRLALSGTPVENHASDIWSILRATVPGLLPGWERFRRDYAAPIERDAQGPARRALASLLGPFVLRRRKADVLRELPQKLEVRADVVLSRGERALYDAIRAEAVATVEQGSPEQRQFAVLAALTRLRQAACHPRLIDPNSVLPSAKHARLREIVAELREEGQQALVFSQFVRQLELAKAALAADGVRLLQLDGSTPAARRGDVVDAFQRGDADVLLISLKAGGTGLNLTAATTVVLLDPWWNPAVEAQAGDRAHRIGQDQPVTIVRLVALGTVEDAILALQDDKRALTEALLAGADGGARLDSDVLLALLAADTPDAALAVAEAAAAAEDAEASPGDEDPNELPEAEAPDAAPAVVAPSARTKRPR